MKSHLLVSMTIAAAVVATSSGCATIPSGRSGVEWTLTQGTIDRTLEEGFHFVSPFSRIYTVDLREQQQEMHVDVLANNGLNIQLNCSILFQPVPGEVANLIRQVGPEYYSTLIVPYVSSGARRVVGRYSPEEIYSTKREQIEAEIREQVGTKLEGQHVRVGAVLIREVHLPQEVEQAIQTKLREEQRALEMQFVLDRERQEAERKRIEAQGIADYQATISKGLNADIIQWNGIEATEKLAESANAKVVVIGSGKEGLPVILNEPATTTPASTPSRTVGDSSTRPR